MKESKGLGLWELWADHRGSNFEPFSLERPSGEVTLIVARQVDRTPKLLISGQFLFYHVERASEEVRVNERACREVGGQQSPPLL